jgi:hypothetical protein
MDTKIRYQVKLSNLFKKFGLYGGFIHGMYERAFDSGNFRNCYVDTRVKNSRKINKKLVELIAKYQTELREENLHETTNQGH